MFAGAVLAAVVTGIVVNALALQRGHHPAPFFGRSFPVPDDAPSAAAGIAVPIPAPRPAAAVARAQPPAAAAAPAETARVAGAPDPIGDLIKGGKPAAGAARRPAHAPQ